MAANSENNRGQRGNEATRIDSPRQDTSSLVSPPLFNAAPLGAAGNLFSYLVQVASESQGKPKP